MYLSDNIIPGMISHWKSLDHQHPRVLALFLGEESEVAIPEIIAAAKSEGIRLFGGLFPAVIHEENHYKSGAVLLDLPSQLGTFAIQEGFDSQGLKASMNSHQGDLTAITLVDGLMPNISQVMDDLQNWLGDRVSFVGGGAGSLSLVQQNCLFTEAGFFQDGALICLVDRKGSHGVKHGWNRLHGPVVATRTENNTIYELNWQNAFEVYKAIVEEDSGQEIRQDNFFDIAKGYPFGIFREGHEDIVRDPITVDEQGALICVGEVPENTVLNILKGENQSLIASAGEASKSSISGLEQAEQVFMVDCISRVIFLDNDYQSELQEVAKHLGALKPEGILSLGEICSDGEGMLTFYNKTIVVSTLS